MGLAVGDAQEGGEHAIVVESDVEFHRALGGAKFGPGKDAETEINCRGIERIEFVFKPEVVARGTRLALRKELAGQLFVKGVGLFFVDPCQRSTANDYGAQVVELGRLSGKIADHIPETGTTRKLSLLQLTPPAYDAGRLDAHRI